MCWESFRSTVRLSLLAAVLTPSIFAGNVINVLWYTAGTTDGGNFLNYESGVGDLAANAGSAPAGNSWNVTFWDGAAMPLGAYNVLVVASPQFIDGADYSSLNSHLPGFGDRVVITGMDADWHYMNSPGPGTYDGPQGFLINSVNWAAAGNGLGAVFLAPQGNVAWNFPGLGNEVSYDGLDNIAIAGGTGALPINSGLSSAGLSDWATSGKEAWDSFDTSKWVALQVNADDPTKAITLASSSVASEDSGIPFDSTPEPSTALLFLSAPFLIWLLQRNR